jgi:hypothetical protein
VRAIHYWPSLVPAVPTPLYCEKPMPLSDIGRQPSRPWNNETYSLLGCMPKYFFHLTGQFPAHDVLGHECANDKEAREHGSFIAHRVGTEKPDMVREGNFISVRNCRDEELFQIPLASTTI